MNLIRGAQIDKGATEQTVRDEEIEEERGRRHREETLRDKGMGHICQRGITCAEPPHTIYKSNNLDFKRFCNKSMCYVF